MSRKKQPARLLFYQPTFSYFSLGFLRLSVTSHLPSMYKAVQPRGLHPLLYERSSHLTTKTNHCRLTVWISNWCCSQMMELRWPNSLKRTPSTKGHEFRVVWNYLLPWIDQKHHHRLLKVRIWIFTHGSSGNVLGLLLVAQLHAVFQNFTSVLTILHSYNPLLLTETTILQNHIWTTLVSHSTSGPCSLLLWIRRVQP